MGDERQWCGAVVVHVSGVRQHLHQPLRSMTTLGDLQRRYSRARCSVNAIGDALVSSAGWESVHGHVTPSEATRFVRGLGEAPTEARVTPHAVSSGRELIVRWSPLPDSAQGWTSHIPARIPSVDPEADASKAMPQVSNRHSALCDLPVDQALAELAQIGRPAWLRADVIGTRALVFAPGATFSDAVAGSQALEAIFRESLRASESDSELVVLNCVSDDLVVVGLEYALLDLVERLSRMAVERVGVGVRHALIPLGSAADINRAPQLANAAMRE